MALLSSADSRLGVAMWMEHKGRFLSVSCYWKVVFYRRSTSQSVWDGYGCFFHLVNCAVDLWDCGWWRWLPIFTARPTFHAVLCMSVCFGGCGCDDCGSGCLSCVFLCLEWQLALSSDFFARVVLVCGVAIVEFLLAGALVSDLLSGRFLHVAAVTAEVIEHHSLVAVCGACSLQARIQSGYSRIRRVTACCKAAASFVAVAMLVLGSARRLR